MAFKTILFHKGVLLACAPVAGVGGIVVGVEHADEIKKVIHRPAPRSHAKQRVAHRPAVRREVARVATVREAIRQCDPIPIDTPYYQSDIELFAGGGGSGGSGSGGYYFNGGTPGFVGGGGGDSGYFPPKNPIPVTPGNPIIPTTPITSPVPEVETWFMMASGLGVVGYAVRRSKIRYAKSTPKADV